MLRRRNYAGQELVCGGESARSLYLLGSVSALFDRSPVFPTVSLKGAVSSSKRNIERMEKLSCCIQKLALRSDLAFFKFLASFNLAVNFSSDIKMSSIFGRPSKVSSSASI